MPSGTKILQMVRPTVSQDALASAEQLVEDIKKGLTIGCMIVAMHKVDLYTVDVAGECKHYRAASRGMVQALDDEFSTTAPITPKQG